jgi:glycerol-3-phosphate acyltransferase PlsY
MLEGFLEIPTVIAAVAAGYFLGALPFAHLAGRFRGIDVFSTGNTLAGTANVFWNVGHRTGALVFVGDLAKGATAVLVAGLLDVSPPLMLVVGGAAVVGHWKSVFTSFRGGDGMVPLMGVTLALVPGLAGLGVLVGVATIVLMWRSSLRSTWGICACFLVMLGVSQYYHIERDLISGLFVLASIVLLKSLFTRRRRSHLDGMSEVDSPDLELEDEILGVTTDSDLPRPIPERR